MHAGRLAAAIALVLAGVLVALFFGALAGIADCETGCKRQGQRAVAFGLSAIGVAVAVTGATLGRGTRRAIATGLVVGGALAAIAAGSEMVRYGAGPLSLATIALGIAAAGGGIRLSMPLPLRAA